jgi:hypothetical protein
MDRKGHEDIGKRTKKPMVPGRQGKKHEKKLREQNVTTLEARRPQLDMVQTVKMVRGFDRVERASGSRWRLPVMSTRDR